MYSENVSLSDLTLKQKLVVAYFCLSMCMLCIADDSPLWAIILVVLNFCNAARLVKKIPLNNEQ